MFPGAETAWSVAGVAGPDSDWLAAGAGKLKRGDSYVHMFASVERL